MQHWLSSESYTPGFYKADLYPYVGFRSELQHLIVSNAISPTDLILGTKVKPNKAHLMAQVTVTFDRGNSILSSFAVFSDSLERCRLVLFSGTST